MSEVLAEYREVNIVQSTNYLSDILRLIIDGKVLLVTSEGFNQRGIVANIIDAIGVEQVIVFDKVTPNPEKAFIQTHSQQFAGQSISNIVAIGGGSVIDTAKVFSALLSYPNQSLGQLFSQNDLVSHVNLIAIPTTSGTGAEVTPFATVWESETNSKHSLYGIKPQSTILDPKLTLTLPYTETLYPALDALSHALESLWNHNRTDASQAYALSAINLICANLRLVLDIPTSLDARRNLQKAATLAGLAISTTKTAISHAISYPLTLQYGVPHGLACSFTLKAILSTQKANELGISDYLLEAIEKLIRSLPLQQALTQYVNLSELISLYEKKLDASRTGNFIDAIDKPWLLNILRSSWSDNLENGIEN